MNVTNLREDPKILTSIQQAVWRVGDNFLENFHGQNRDRAWTMTSFKDPNGSLEF